MIALLCFVVGVQAVTPLFQQHEDAAVYTSAGISKQGNWGSAPESPLFASATWLNEPIFTELWDAKGTIDWKYQSSSPTAMFDVSVARHVDSNSSGPVQLAVLESFLGGGDCNLRGFTGASGGGKPVWTYTLTNCSANEVSGEEGSSLEMSDDGSTVAIAVWSTFNGTEQTGQLHVLDAQTGKLLYFVKALTGFQLHVSLSRHGDWTAFTDGRNVTVYSRKGVPRAPTFVAPGLGYLCPMGVFLLSGSTFAVLYEWNQKQGEYVNIWSESGVDPSGNQWFFYTGAITVNGGGSSPDGCLMALGWIDATATTVKVSVWNMLTLKNYWTWTSFTNAQDQTVPQLAWHMNYLALAQWGGTDAQGNQNPTIALWNTASNATIFSYVTPGSMFAIDVLLNTAAPPPPGSLTRPVGSDVVYLMAAGKDVPASEMGRGGDVFAFQLTF